MVEASRQVYFHDTVPPLRLIDESAAVGRFVVVDEWVTREVIESAENAEGREVFADLQEVQPPLFVLHTSPFGATAARRPKTKRIPILRPRLSPISTAGERFRTHYLHLFGSEPQDVPGRSPVVAQSRPGSPADVLTAFAVVFGRCAGFFVSTNVNFKTQPQLPRQGLGHRSPFKIPNFCIS